MRLATLFLALHFVPVAGADDKKSADELRKEIAALEARLAELHKQLDAIEPAGVPHNELVPDLADNLAKYKGRTITLKATYIAVGGKPLRGWGNGQFEAHDPKGNVTFKFFLDLPKSDDYANAKDGEEVIVTFLCGETKGHSQGVAKAIRRPK